MKKELYKKFKKIKLVLTDVDGVLTDGGMYYTTQGDIMKKFHFNEQYRSQITNEVERIRYINTLSCKTV